MRAWTHVAAVFEPDRKISVFIDGKQAATLPIEGNFVPARRGSLTIGRTNRPQTWNEFQLTTKEAHFHLTTFVQWKDHEKTRSTRTRIMLQGMTDKTAGELVPLAKSWLQAPKMKLRSQAYRGGRYDQSERAYLVEATDPGQSHSCSFVVDASKESPLLNPAFIIRNWGNRPATLSINGRHWKRGEDLRQGIRRGIDGDDLIVWIRLEEQSPVEILVGRGEGK